MATATIESDAIRMANDPPKYFGYSNDAAHRAPRDEIDELQRAGLRERFRDLRDNLPVLKSAADEQGIAPASFHYEKFAPSLTPVSEEVA